MLDIESMISAQRVVALKKYFADGNSSWEAMLDKFFCDVRGKFFLFCFISSETKRYWFQFRGELFT